jgi:hypothetical protein
MTLPLLPDAERTAVAATLRDELNALVSLVAANLVLRDRGWVGDDWLGRRPRLGALFAEHKSPVRALATPRDVASRP